MKKTTIRVFSLLTVVISVLLLASCNREMNPEKAVLKDFHIDIQGNYNHAEIKRFKEKYDGLTETVTMIKVKMSKDSYEKILPQIKEYYNENTDDPESFESDGNFIKNVWSEYPIKIKSDFSTIFGRSETGKSMKTVPMFIGVVSEDENVTLYFSMIDDR